MAYFPRIMKIKKKISKYQNVILTSEFRTAFFHDNLKLISKLLIKHQVNEGVNCTVGICQPHNKLKCSVLQYNLMYTVQTDKDKERTPTQSKQNSNNDHQGNFFCCLYGFRVPRILTSFISRRFSRQKNVSTRLNAKPSWPKRARRNWTPKHRSLICCLRTTGKSQ